MRDHVTKERPILMSVAEVAALFDRTDRSIRNWVKRGFLHPIRIGRSVFFDEREVLGMTEKEDENGPE